MGFRWFSVIMLTSVAFTCVNILFLWNQLNQMPSSNSQGSQVCDCDRAITEGRVTEHMITNSTSAATSVSVSASITSAHKLAVIVPFRDRFEEMMEFVPHIHAFLQRQEVDHEMWIMNQVDKHRFNRAALLNIGFLLSRNTCDYLVMHDIDLLPLNDQLLYRYPTTGPLHISSPALHPLYHYRTFVGGILIMSRSQYEKVNGLSNLFWGWGREDDELYTRMREKNMEVHYPQGITTGYQTFKHMHDRHKRPRDQKAYKNQWDLSRRKDRKTGFSTVKYDLVSSVEMSIDGAKFHFVSVEVHCDYKVTPFCDNPS